MKYVEFSINNFKAIKKTSIDLTRDQLVLILGVNESGKTSILKAIEAFDHTNDPIEPKQIFSSIRNKRELNSAASVSSTILLEDAGLKKFIEIANSIYDRLNPSPDPSLTPPEEMPDIAPLVMQIDAGQPVTITRTFIFENAEFVNEKYTLDTESLSKISPVLGEDVIDEILRALVGESPLIIYFEDFKDHIPDYICTQEGAQYYDADWVSTLEGLFFHADKKVSISQFENIADDNARVTALNRVNNALNKQFTARWNKKLKGTKSIDRVELTYNHDSKLFKFTAVGRDKETVFDIDERSKGASWYLTFLLKTEFRKKHLKLEHGQTLYLIDEPGSNLHSTAQTNMVHDFRTLSTDSIVIYTTHSQHLIDKANLSNVYIVKVGRSGVEAERFQEYVLGKKINTTFYQPIIDALEIQPYSLDFAWKKALLVEGISDYAAFKLMFESILGNKLDFVIMPGTSASKLETLISLHIGWGAKLMVLLDFDDEGCIQRDSYKDKFPILTSKIQTYEDTPLRPSKKTRLENLFAKGDRELLLKVAQVPQTGGDVSKKEFQAALYIVGNNPKAAAAYKSKVTESTKKNFSTLFDHINKVIG